MARDANFVADVAQRTNTVGDQLLTDVLRSIVHEVVRGKDISQVDVATMLLLFDRAEIVSRGFKVLIEASANQYA